MRNPTRRSLWRPVVAAACGLLLVACVRGATGSDAATASREPFEQSFGPSYPAQPPEGSPTRIQSAELSENKQTLTVHFVGGDGFLASDPCSTDYEPWIAANGEALDVTVIQVAHEQLVSLAPNHGCRLIGYLYTYRLALPSAFSGTTVNDLAGGTLFVARPPGLAVVSHLPTTWGLQGSFEQEPGPPPIWVQVYSADEVADGDQSEGPGRLVLYQAFGAIGEWTDTRAEKARERGANHVAVTVNGEGQTLWQDGASGELLLGWTLDGKSLGLVGNTADMTADDLVKMAESVALEGN